MKKKIKIYKSKIIENTKLKNRNILKWTKRKFIANVNRKSAYYIINKIKYKI